MPLIKKSSKKAFEHNVKAEMDANPSPKDRAQNLAIAYSVQKQAKKKHMAKGGMMEPMNSMEKREDHEMHSMKPHGMDMSITDDDSIPNSMAEAIMKKRKAKMMAEGGMVDIHENEEEQPNSYYHQNEHEALDLDLDSTMDGMHQPEDSNEHSMEPGLGEEDEHADDIISKIMRKRKSK